MTKEEINELKKYTSEKKNTEKVEISVLQLNRVIKALEQKPCEDSISRQEAIRIAEQGQVQGYEWQFKELVKLPSVNPQPKTGHWIETAEEYYKAVNEYCGGVNENTPYFVDDIACSECLAKYSVIDNETERFDHCPSCGAKMEEVE